MSEIDIVEPLSVKEQIIKSATEVASMILRIDDVIASSKSAGWWNASRWHGWNATRWHGWYDVNLFSIFLFF